MKTSLRLLSSIAVLLLATNSVNAQLKLKKPEIKVPEIKTPKIGGEGKEIEGGGIDKSGLFINTTKDPSAEHHRKKVVENLEALEAEYKKSTIDYELVDKLIKETDRSLESISKLEPNVNSSRFNNRYSPVKEKAKTDLGTYDEVKKMEKDIAGYFGYNGAKIDYSEPDVLSFRSDKNSRKSCYCGEKFNENNTTKEFDAKKNDYNSLTAKLTGYSDAKTAEYFKNMETCQQNGNKYAIWASKENLEKDVTEYGKKMKADKPQNVIKRCDEYSAALKRINEDYSLKLSADAKNALSEGTKKVNDVKADCEKYISSGEFDKYKAKVHAENIAKVEFPKAKAKDAALEAGAIKYVKDEEFGNYLKSYSNSPVASVMQAHLVTEKPIIKKNSLDLPKWKYHIIWVAYKGKDGNCYITPVYASYSYMGGGTYETIPTWGADAPDEIACANVK